MHALVERFACPDARDVEIVSALVNTVGFYRAAPPLTQQQYAHFSLIVLLDKCHKHEPFQVVRLESLIHSVLGNLSSLSPEGGCPELSRCVPCSGQSQLMAEGGREKRVEQFVEDALTNVEDKVKGDLRESLRRRLIEPSTVGFQKLLDYEDEPSIDSIVQMLTSPDPFADSASLARALRKATDSQWAIDSDDDAYCASVQVSGSSNELHLSSQQSGPTPSNAML